MRTCLHSALKQGAMGHFALFLVAAGAAAGCGKEGDGGLVPGEMMGPEAGPPRLELVGPAARTLGFAESHTVSVRYVSDLGEGIADAPVQFTLEGSARGSRLLDDRAITQSGGIASVTLEAGTEIANFDLVAAADRAAPVSIRVEVVVPGDERLEYTVRYRGRRDVDRVEVGLFAMADCPTLRTVAPRPNAVDFPRLGERRQLDAQPGRSYALAAVGVDGDGRVTTDACRQLEFAGAPHHEVLDLSDFGSDRAGAYDVDETFDMSETIPDSLRGLLDVAEGLYTDPGQFVVDFVRDHEDVPDTVSAFLDVSGPVFAGLINDSVDDLDTPEVLSDLGAVATNLRGAIREVTLRGSMTFEEASEPDEFGLGGGEAGGLHELRELIVQTGDMPTPRAVDLESPFEFTEGRDETQVEIGEHAFALALEEVVDIVFEETLLGDDEPSLRTLVEQAIDCDAVVAEADDTVTRTLAGTACDFAIESLLGRVTDLHEDLSQYDTLVLREEAVLRGEAEGTSLARWVSSETGEAVEFDGILEGAAQPGSWPTHPVHEAIADGPR